MELQSRYAIISFTVASHWVMAFHPVIVGVCPFVSDARRVQFVMLDDTLIYLLFIFFNFKALMISTGVVRFYCLTLINLQIIIRRN
ncbi:MAG: hypothetical protein HQL83_10305 [Magnetococcales bacterium]|nr:hypothetical protein [Magnetococcales bacterium]MBF0347846.1 hypothetical protein [Magnetococcales bacterium]